MAADTQKYEHIGSSTVSKVKFIEQKGIHFQKKQGERLERLNKKDSTTHKLVSSITDTFREATVDGHPTKTHECS